MQLSIFAKVVAALLTLVFSGAQAHSMFGYPSMGFGGFGNPRFASSPYSGYGNRRPHAVFRDNYHDESDPFHYRPPCPRYEPMSASAWTDSGKGYFTSFVALPGVSSHNRRVWLGEDGNTVYLTAARALPSQGLRCIPREAQLSRDARSEVFETSLTLPDGSNAEEATIHQVRGGIELNVPKLVTGPTQQAAQDADSLGGASQASAYRGQGSHPTESTSPHVILAPEVKFVLPYPSDGVEISDEPYPEVIKDADAAEGYFDNRGEFHEY